MIRKRLDSRGIFHLWIPMALTWLMMSVEGPFLAALIARLQLPKFNLAAFGVAFSFALIIEAPIIMIMSASTALVDGRYNYHQLRNYTFLLNGVITLLMFIGLFPPVFYFISEKLIELPRNVAHLTHISSIILIPWPAAIGFRRFYHGLLIRDGLTRRVAYGTVVRLVSMGGTAIFLYLHRVNGAYLGAISLSTGVVAESIFSRLAVNDTLKKILSIQTDGRENLTFTKITRFYTPLALTSILSLGVNPIITFFLGRSRYGLESLAVLPVINSFIFLFKSVGLSMQEVIIAVLASGNENFNRMKQFVLRVGKYLLIILVLICFTPLIFIWFRDVSGLAGSLTDFAILPARLLAMLPMLTLLISFQRSVLVHIKHTSPIKWASLIELVLIILTLYLSLVIIDLPGVIGAAAAYLTGRIGANIYLIRFQKRAEYSIRQMVLNV